MDPQKPWEHRLMTWSFLNMPRPSSNKSDIKSRNILPIFMILGLSLLAPKQAGNNCMQDFKCETNSVRLQAVRNRAATSKRSEFTPGSYQLLCSTLYRFMDTFSSSFNQKIPNLQYGSLHRDGKTWIIQPQISHWALETFKLLTECILQFVIVEEGAASESV